MDQNAKAKALAFLKRHFIGVLGTISPEGTPHSRTVYYACNDYFTLYFSTLKNTRKYADLLANPKVSFTVSTEDMPQTLQCEGVASEVTDNDKLEEDLAQLIEPLMQNTNYQWPITKMDKAEVVLMQIKPTWIRWGDFTILESGDENIFTQLL